MIRYLAKRALSSLVAFFLFITLMFFVVQIIIPTDFTTQFAMTMNQDAREELAQELGIDRPLWEQYLNWLRMLLTGSLGTSFYGPSVVKVLKGVIPYTLLVFFTGTVLALPGTSPSCCSALLSTSSGAPWTRFSIHAYGGAR